MTVSVANVELANTFGHWVARTNELAEAMSVKAVTVNSNAAVGNAQIIGTFTANNLVVDAISSSNTITFNSAVNFVGSTTVTGFINFKDGSLFDSVSTMRVLGSNASNFLLAANVSTGNLYFANVNFDLNQLNNVNTAGAVNGSILQFNSTANSWNVGTLTTIPTTSIGNLAVTGTVTSDLTVAGVVNLSNSTIITTANSSVKRVGINGVTAPQASLHVNGAIVATGDVIAFFTSDERLKDNVLRIPSPLGKLSNIEGVTFTWKADLPELSSPRAGKDVGVIAQQVQKVLPEAVKEREDGYLAVSYERLVPLLIEAIKELEVRVDTLQSRLDILETKCDGN